MHAGRLNSLAFPQPARGTPSSCRGAQSVSWAQRALRVCPAVLYSLVLRSLSFSKPKSRNFFVAAEYVGNNKEEKKGCKNHTCCAFFAPRCPSKRAPQIFAREHGSQRVLLTQRFGCVEVAHAAVVRRCALRRQGGSRGKPSSSLAREISKKKCVFCLSCCSSLPQVLHQQQQTEYHISYYIKIMYYSKCILLFTY